MKFTSTVVCIAAFVLGLFLTSSLVHSDEIVLKAAGCKTEFYLFKDLAEAFKEATGNKLLPAAIGNKKAVKLLLEQKIDFAFTCKPIAKLKKKLKLNPEQVAAWKSIPVAKDPIIVVSNAKNGVQNLTSEQLTKLFSGQIENWKELGGNDLPVLTAHLNPKLESGVVLLFKEFTLGSKGKLDPNARTGDSPSMLGNFVSLTPGSVTFMGFNSYKEKYGDIVGIDGVFPGRQNILNGSYKLAATYYLTLDGRDNKGVNEFMNFIQSDAGSQAIEQNFISVVQK